MDIPPIALQKTKNFLIAIDSDGCVFDSMEIKHKECFCPVTIRHYSLQAISKYARESWEFVNLYSVRRGMNRFPALIQVMDQLRTRPEVVRRDVTIPWLDELRSWTESTSRLGNPALAEAAEHTPVLKDAWIWSDAVNQAVQEMVHGVPPFPGVLDVLTIAASRADMMVASSTPVAALQREWGEHGLSEYVGVIAGQEMGPKSHQLATVSGNSYVADHVLMIGDAFSDYRAAKTVGACFYPILPGEEESSWDRLLNEALDRFFCTAYLGTYEHELITELRKKLPERPPWELPRGK